MTDAHFGLADVTVRRGARVDLDAASLDLRPGSLTAVVGGDGAGKTTLLQVLVGAVVPTSGSVRSPSRDRIGYVSAGPGVYPDLSVVENLRFTAAGYGWSGDRLRGRIDDLLASTGLLDARDRLASRLSGGMRQKLAFACAVLHRPALLVMDEPTTGVDPISRAELWRLVSGALAEGTAAVFATTYVDEAARADDVVVLDHGRTIAHGAPSAILSSVPGTLVRTEAPLPDVASWRRGRVRHAWVPPGTPPPPGASRVEPDLEDAVIVSALAVDAKEGP